MEQFNTAVDRKTLTIVALCALWMLLFETVFFQLITFTVNYLQACQVISMALLGIGLGGIVASIVPSRNAMQVAVTAGWAMPVSVLASLALIMLFPSRTALIELALASPFILGSLIISIQLTLHPCHKVYFADLVGAALGVAATTLCLPLLREEGSVLLLVSIGAFIALMITNRTKASLRLLIAAQIVAGLIAGMAIFGIITNQRFDWLNVAQQVRENPEDRNKIYSRLARERRSQPSDETVYKRGLGSLIERVDVVKRRSRYVVYYNGYPNDHFTRNLPARHRHDRRLPVGLMHVMDPDQRVRRAMIPERFDLSPPSRALRVLDSGLSAALSRHWPTLRAISDPGHTLYEPKDVMIVGPAAEGITKPAKIAAGTNGRVVGVEINPAIVKLMTEIYDGDVSGHAYDDMEIRAMDARAYLADSKRSFDMITMLNTHRIRTVGDVGPPEYLHTYEAFSSYFDHMNDRGVIVLEERALSEKAPYGIARIVLTAGRVLTDRFGAQDLSRQILVYTWIAGSKYVSILIKKTPFTDEELAWLDKSWRMHNSPARRVRWSAFPGFHTGSVYEAAVSGIGLAKLAPPTTHNMSLITDEKPFPYDVFKARDEHWRVIRRVAIFALLLGVLPALLLGVGLFARKRVRNPGRAGVLMLYAMALGLGYLLTEIVLIQRFQMFLDSPIWAVLVVLGVMLFASGLGSLFGGSFHGRKAALAFVAILAAILFCAYAVPGLLRALIFLPLSLRIVVSALIVGSIGFFMGMPLPICLNMLAKSSGPRLSAMAFGLNGSAGAVATSVALLTNKLYGFTGTLWLSAAAYALALLLMLAAGAGAPADTSDAEG
ncbi:MAG: hypothetical protein P9M14_05340 [Candidatus Alcyoniella australis]|nr:hypothetical protein [Candidatus Alcyoniella australis]